MIIEEIIFNNFRCFFGEQSLKLASDDGSHLTVVHAQNGSGKTSLLNCIMWTFYGVTTAGFDQITGSIANDEHLASGGTEAWVEILFKFDKSRYRARRFFDKTKPLKEQSSNFKVWRIESNGHNSPQPHPENLIETMMPRSMAEYFFFDGEKARSIAGVENSVEISRAIRNILGCSVAEMALEDLKVVEKKYRDALTQTYSSKELVDLNNQLERHLNTQGSLNSQIETAKEQVDLQQQRISDIQKQLLAQKESEKLQSQIQSNRRQETKSAAKIDEANAKLVRWPDTNAIPLVSKRLTENVKKIIEGQKIEHKIPDQYQKPVIEQLLEDQTCICGTHLEANSDEFLAVQALLESSADSAQIERYSNVQATVVKFNENQRHSRSELLNIINEQSDAEADLAEAQQRLKSLGTEFKNIDNALIQDLKQREDEARKELSNFIARNERAKLDLQDLDRKIRETRKELESAERRSSINEKLAYKRDCIAALQEEIRARLDEHVASAIRVITAKVNGILSKVAAQEMKFSLNSDFKISVLISGRKRPLSEGQQQLVGLIFLGALVDFCKVRKNAKSELLLPGTTAPLILDAPFSKLDNEYMPDVARVLPEMAEQMVLMLSGSHSTNQVMKNFEPFVGKQYVITRHNKAEAGPDAKSWEISLNGKTYVRNLFNQQHDSSFIEDVN